MDRSTYHGARRRPYSPLPTPRTPSLSSRPYRRYITYCLYFTIIAALITLITGPTVLKYSSHSLLFVYFVLFGFTSVAFCFLVSVFFSKAKTASSAGIMIFFAGWVPYASYNTPDVEYSTKLGLCFVAPTAFSFGAQNFGAFEEAGVGVTWSNVDEDPGTNISLQACMQMLAIDFVL